MKIKNDFSWRLCLAVLAAHVLLVLWINLAFAPQLVMITSASPRGVQVTLLEPQLPVIPAPAPESKIALKTTLKPAPKPIPAAAPTEPLAQAPAPTSAFALLPRAHAHHFAPPESMRLHYAVTKGGDSAKASLTWRTQSHADQPASYELIYEATYFGVSVLKQTSVGLLGDAGLAPLRFGDKRRGKAEQATHFDADKQHITFSNNRPEAPLVGGEQDRSSVLVQLVSLFAAKTVPWQAGQVIEMPVASTDELETWRFEVLGEEQLALPAGELPAVHLMRRARRAFDQTVELWLAPSLGYVPVRIRQSDSSGVTDAQLLGREKL